ncbi:MAG: hypothetical protein OXU20_14315 [Myxococcales bacterium]|nr:hypothetical protein [Myxococcales bacterium]MDD9969491.1 hypothetical protein [Myxococcales bacterium]
MRNKIGVVAGFAVGFAIGYHWPKIYRSGKQLSLRAAGWAIHTAEESVRLAARTKERLEDALAEARYAARQEEAGNPELRSETPGEGASDPREPVPS